MIYLFQVMKQYRHQEVILLAEFKEQRDARLFIEAKLIADSIHEPEGNAHYFLCEGADCLESYSQANRPQTQLELSLAKPSEATSLFRPTPFNTSPHPSGTPPPWWHEPKDDKKE